MRLSSLADYAILMMSAAARHCGVGAQLRGRPVRLNATSLSAETGIPLPTAQKLVSRLSSAGLFEATRGTGGGVRLSRPPAAISLADIIEAVEGPIALTPCIDPAGHDDALDGGNAPRPHLDVVNRVVRDALAGVSLASLATPTPLMSSEVETRVRSRTKTSEPRPRSDRSLDFARDERVRGAA